MKPAKIPSFIRFVEGLDENRVELAAAESSDGPRRFKMLAYTGAPVLTGFGPMIFDLAGMDADKEQLPILRQHDPNRIVGMGVSKKVNDKRVLIEGTLLKSSAAAQEVAQYADENFPWQASIGIEFQELKWISPDEKLEINGKKHAGPLYVATKSRLRESSFVPIGADGATKSVVLSGPEVSVSGADEPPAQPNEQEPNMSDPAKPVVVAQASIKELKAKFPNREKFVLDQFEAGATIESAELAFVKLENAELTAAKEAADKEIGELKAKLAAPPVPPAGVKPLGGGQPKEAGKPAGDGTALAAFNAKVNEIAQERKLSRAQAAAAVSKEHPELREAMLAEANPAKLEAVKAICG